MRHYLFIQKTLFATAIMPPFIFLSITTHRQRRSIVYGAKPCELRVPYYASTVRNAKVDEKKNFIGSSAPPTCVLNRG